MTSRRLTLGMSFPELTVSGDEVSPDVFGCTGDRPCPVEVCIALKSLDTTVGPGEPTADNLYNTGNPNLT